MPVWIAALTRSGTGVAQSTAASRRCIAAAPATASRAFANTMNLLSPSPRGFTRIPPWATTASSIASSCWRSASNIKSGASSNKRVLPSTSVKRNVTTPSGSSCFMPKVSAMPMTGRCQVIRFPMTEHPLMGVQRLEPFTTQDLDCISLTMKDLRLLLMPVSGYAGLALPNHRQSPSG